MMPFNLLGTALSVIGTQTVVYRKYLSRAPNVVGEEVATYETDVDIEGSFQPVPASLYMVNGLDFGKKYFTLYAQEDILDIQRDVSGDQIESNSKLYQVLDENDWFDYNGWKGVLCVRQ